MKITLGKLKEFDACREGLEYFEAQKFNETEHELLIDHLMKNSKYNWSNWLVDRLLNSDNKIKYAIYDAAAAASSYAAYAAAAYTEASYAYNETLKKIINYGLELIKEQDNVNIN